MYKIHGHIVYYNNLKHLQTLRRWPIPADLSAKIATPLPKKKKYDIILYCTPRTDRNTDYLY